MYTDWKFRRATETFVKKYIQKDPSDQEQVVKNAPHKTPKTKSIYPTVDRKKRGKQSYIFQ